MNLKSHLFLIVLLPVCSLTVPCSADDVVLTQHEQQLLRSGLVPAAIAGDPVQLLPILQRTIKRFSGKMELVDQFVSDANLPPVEQLLLQSRIAIVLNSDQASPILPTQEETHVVAPKLVQMCRAALSESEACVQELNQSNIESFRELEDLLASERAQCQRVDQSIKLAEFGSKLPAPSREAQNGREASNWKPTDFLAIQTELEKVLNSLHQAGVNLRVGRCKKVQLVLDDSQSHRERLMAIKGLIADAAFFRALFPQDLLPRKIKKAGYGKLATARPIQVNRAILDWIPECIEKVEERELLVAYHFDSGLSWWLRGRFGSGPLGGGLLKDPRAKGTESILHQLDMPLEYPDLSKYESDADRLPMFCERRHHLQWQWENRGISFGGKVRNPFTNPEEYQVRWTKVHT